MSTLLSQLGETLRHEESLDKSQLLAKVECVVRDLDEARFSNHMLEQEVGTLMDSVLQLQQERRK
jgi:CHASE1-domain containing sensor protein